MPTREDKLFTRYVDPTGELSNRELIAGTWYVRHKALFKNILIAVLFVWCIASIGGSILYMLFYISEGYWSDQKILTEEVNRSAVNVAARTRMAALPLQFGAIEVFESSKDRFTPVATVDNPNMMWLATVSYRFVFDGGTTTIQTAVVLPGQSSPLPVFGGVVGTFPTNIKLEIVNQSWRRLSARIVAKPAEFVPSRTDITISDVVVGDPPGTDPIPGVRIQGVMHNNTAFGFEELKGTLTLLRAGSPVGYMPLFIDEFLPGEARPIDVRVPGAAAPIDSVQFTPNIDILSPDTYLTPERI